MNSFAIIFLICYIIILIIFVDIWLCLIMYVCFQTVARLCVNGVHPGVTYGVLECVPCGQPFQLPLVLFSVA